MRLVVTTFSGHPHPPKQPAYRARWLPLGARAPFSSRGHDHRIQGGETIPHDLTWLLHEGRVVDLPAASLQFSARLQEELVVLLGPTRVPREDELQSILTPSATIPTNRLTPLLWDCEMARNDDSLDADGSEWSASAPL